MHSQTVYTTGNHQEGGYPEGGTFGESATLKHKVVTLEENGQLEWMVEVMVTSPMS